MTAQKAIDELNRLWAKMVGEGSGKRRNYALFWATPRKWKGRKYKIGYTPWKIKGEDGKVGFYALKYGHGKKAAGHLIKAVRFGKRKTARLRSIEWWNQVYRKGEHLAAI